MRYAVIIAGGSGTRLWPMSRAATPKQLIPLIGGQSLLEIAVGRLERLLPPERCFVCAGQAHAEAIARALPRLGPQQFFGEPCGRDTLNAIGFSAAVIARHDPEAPDRRLHGRPRHRAGRSIPRRLWTTDTPWSSGIRKRCSPSASLRPVPPPATAIWSLAKRSTARPGGCGSSARSPISTPPGSTSLPGRSDSCGTAECSCGGPTRCLSAFAATPRQSRRAGADRRRLGRSPSPGGSRRGLPDAEEDQRRLCR